MTLRAQPPPGLSDEEFDVDVIWIMAGNGDCIASSKLQTIRIIRPHHYADRTYFTSAHGRITRPAYAVGR